MGCIINWDDATSSALENVDVGESGCIVLWAGSKGPGVGQKLAGCLVQWDEVMPTADADGCIVNWDEKAIKTNLAAASAKGGCLINWTDADLKTLSEAAEKGCVVNW